MARHPGGAMFYRLFVRAAWGQDIRLEGGNRIVVSASDAFF